MHRITFSGDTPVWIVLTWIKILDKINKEKIWRLIQSTGDDLIGKLPHHPNHPNGRNPYAHVALKVKNNFGKSYKDLPDDKINEVMTYLNFIKNTEGKKN